MPRWLRGLEPMLRISCGHRGDSCAFCLRNRLTLERNARSLQAGPMASSPAELDLPEAHRAFGDSAYRPRRARIASIAERYVPRAPIPDVPYTPVENQVWNTVSTELAAKHARLACRAS